MMVKHREVPMAEHMERLPGEVPVQISAGPPAADEGSPGNGVSGGSGSETGSEEHTVSESGSEAIREPETAESAEAIASTARRLERERISQILQHPEARGREGLAGHLATKSEMSAEEAFRILKLAPRQVSNSSGGLLEMLSRSTAAEVRKNDA